MKHKMDEDEVLYRIILIFLALGIVFTAAIFWLDLKDIFFVPCPFLQMTGLACPGCGGTRAVKALLAGEILESIHFHPLVIYMAGFLLCFLGSHTLKHLSGGRIKGMHFKKRYLVIAAIILVINFIIKNTH